MTVPELAAHLETSERTVRRDLEALSLAGVPVYSLRGRGGGWQLLGGHRIDLSGLTADEAQALLLVTGPAVAALGPGIARGLAAARRKVLAALPEVLRVQVEAAAQTVLVDPSRWGLVAAAPAAGGTPGGTAGGRATTGRQGEEGLLHTLRCAVGEALQVDVEYEPPGRDAYVRRLHPHGLVCKRGVWYLLATSAAGLRTYRVSRVRSVHPTEEPVTRPPDFDLARAWAEVQRGIADRTPAPVVVEVVVTPGAMRRLRATVGSWWPVQELDSTGDGRVHVTLRFPSPSLAAAELAGFGASVEVQAPDAVRAELAAIGEWMLAAYGPPTRSAGAPSPVPAQP